MLGVRGEHRAVGGRWEARDPACPGMVLWRSKEPTVSPQHKLWAAQLVLTTPGALHRCPYLPTPTSASSQSNIGGFWPTWGQGDAGGWAGMGTCAWAANRGFSFSERKRGTSPFALECHHQLRHLQMPIAQYLECWVDTLSLFSPLSGGRLYS